VRGSIGYQRIFPFAKSEHAPVETLDVSLGASPISQVVWIVGRALRVNGEPQVAPVLGAQFAHRCAEADQRLKEAAEELAAVSTFIRTALELEALGAPAALVARCMGAAREEVHHLRDQLLLAGRSGLDAAHLEVLDPEPRRFGSRSEALCALATESWVDGWFGERQALNAIRRLRDSASDDQVARIWHAVGEEEASHVRLSGDIVDWCVKEGGSLVRAALRAA